MKLMIIWNTYNTILDPVLIFPFVYQSDCHEALNEFLSRCDMADFSSMKLLEVFKNIMITIRELLYEADVIWNPYNTLLDPVLKFPFAYQSDCQALLNKLRISKILRTLLDRIFRTSYLSNGHKQRTVIWSWWIFETLIIHHWTRF